MSIDKIGYLPVDFKVNAATTPQAVDQPDFALWLKDQINTVNEQMAVSDKGWQAVALGKADNLHQVMIASEKAKINFELLAQIRNRLLSAYQQIMREQV